MAYGSYHWADVLCPFYKTDDGKQRITCEGVGEACNLVQVYRYKSEFERQMKIFCCEHYKKCEIYRMIIETKYEEDPNESKKDAGSRCD